MAAEQAAAAAFRPDVAYEKHPRVAIRHEDFGGLAYHYGHRRLVFLKSAALVPAAQVRACSAALPRLLAANVIRVRPADG